MTLHNKITFEEGVRLEKFPTDPSDVEWKSKSKGLSAGLDHFRLTTDGRLERLDQERKETTKEEEPETYDAARGRFKRTSEIVSEEWVEEGFHGTFTFYTTYDGTRWRYEARFSEGTLDEYLLLSPRQDE